MLQLVVGGFIALASGWILDGGVRRRARRTIREEIELADLLGDELEDARTLRANAEARLARYVTPFWARVRRLRTPERAAWIVAVVTGLVSAVSALNAVSQHAGEQAGSKFVQGVTAGALLGSLAVATYGLLEYGSVPFARLLVRSVRGLVEATYVTTQRVVMLVYLAVRALATRLLYGRRR